MPDQALHEYSGPLVVAAVGTTRDLVNRLVAVVPDIRPVLAVEIGVVFRGHGASTPPVLIADAKERKCPWFRSPVLPPQCGHLAVSVCGDVLDPLLHFLYCPAADIPADVRIAAELAAEIQKLMRTDVIVLSDAPPVRVDPFWSPVPRPYAVAPVVLIGKTPTRPPEHRDPDCTKGVHNIIPEPPRIRYLGFLTHPQPLVDAPTKMLREMAVYEAAYGMSCFSHLCYDARTHVGPSRIESLQLSERILYRVISLAQGTPQHRDHPFPAIAIADRIGL